MNAFSQNADDSRVLQAGERTDLPADAREQGLLRNEHSLDGRWLTSRRMFTVIDDTHSALAERAENAIRTDDADRVLHV